MRTLIRLTHGLGDAVPLTGVLPHPRRRWPGWTIDVAAPMGKHSAPGTRNLVHAPVSEALTCAY